MRTMLLALLILLTCNVTRAEDGVYRIAVVDCTLQAESLELVLDAYSRIGIPVQVVTFPAERALYNSSHGLVDAELERTAVTERQYPDLIRVPVVISEYEVVVLTKRDLPHVSTWEELAPYRLGIEIGLKYLEEITKGLRVTWYSDREHMFSLLDMGRLDMVVYYRRPAVEVLRHMGLQNIRCQQPPLEVVPAYHYVHREHEFLIPVLTRTLEEVIRERRQE